MNVCEMCQEDPDHPEIYDTGTCSLCHQDGECRDPELLALYRGMGLSEEFIYRHLPRLRKSLSNELTWQDIGREISRHAVLGACRPHSCQGYHREVRSEWRFGG